jgi:hypothetical protein
MPTSGAASAGVGLGLPVAAITIIHSQFKAHGQDDQRRPSAGANLALGASGYNPSE